MAFVPVLPKPQRDRHHRQWQDRTSSMAAWFTLSSPYCTIGAGIPRPEFVELKHGRWQSAADPLAQQAECRTWCIQSRECALLPALCLENAMLRAPESSISALSDPQEKSRHPVKRTRQHVANRFSATAVPPRGSCERSYEGKVVFGRHNFCSNRRRC
ncbi:uncharacterized protein PV07_02606 [Cladophialophora immunda]|uniref:Uncharacterized protein n=1 Tax=Cladophialophora immunda TaxID=569365 RepID=A0A0D2D5H4_9EURO|nr:uncharacterized protein PV07_02606 [Cladophialophora immunda]KIW30914.1 hypothetical protein PV07_02606 [Cladophialophora immunda]